MTATDTHPPSFWRRALDFGWEIWGVLRRPSSVFSLGALVFAGFVAGIIFWGAFNTALELTNTEGFCTSCHEMRSNVFEELKPTVHYTNRSGVRAHCPDCHVPHNWTDKIARKMQASKEVWGWLFGTINTREKFLDHRLELAMHEWARMKANDSLECRNCHSARAVDAHQRFLFTAQKTCIDCHKGIAHRLPDMSSVPGWQ
jgi:cytochrome c-type protein NapC